MMDYDAVAGKFGGESSDIDYDAIAKKFNAKVVNTEPIDAYKETAKNDSVGENLLAGIGGGMYGMYLGAKDIVGQASPEEVQQYKDSMAGLHTTTGGIVGDIIGQAAPMVVGGAGAFALGSKVPAIAGMANSMAGRAGLSAISGGIQGALVPTGEDESRAGNIALGAGVGAISSAVLERGIKALTKAGSKVMQARAAKQALQSPQINIQVDNYLANSGIDLTGLSNEAQKKAREFAALAVTSGAKVNPDEIVRQSVLDSLPVPMQGTKGQLGQQFAQQDNERVLADVPLVGAKLRDTFEQQRGQLGENFDALINQTRGTATSSKEMGAGLQGEALKRYSAAKAATKAAYQEADAVAGDTLGKPSNEIINWLDQNQGFDDVGGLITKAKKLGIISTDDAGNLVAGEAPLKNFYELRKTISAKSVNNGSLAEAKNLVDNTFDAYGGELYGKAAGLRRTQGTTFESGTKAVQDIVKLKAGSTDLKTAPDDVFQRYVISGNRDDLINLKKLVYSGDKDARKAGLQQFENVKKQTLQYLKDASVKDTNGKSNFTIAGLEQAYNRIGKDNLEEILGKGGLKQLDDLVKAANITQKQQPRLASNSATASRLASMAMSIFNILDKVPVVGAAAKPIGNVVVKGAQASNALKNTPMKAITDAQIQKTLASNKVQIPVRTLTSLMTGASLKSGEQ